MAKKNNKKNTGLGIALWILASLIILIIFLVKQNEIKSNLKTTNFFARIFGKTPTFISDHKIEEEKLPEEKETVIVLKTPEKKETTVERKDDSNLVAPQLKPVEPDKNQHEKENSTKKSTTDTKVVAETKKETVAVVKNPEPIKKTEERTVPAAESQLKTKVCFIAIDQDGPVVRRQVSRSVLKEAPLTESIKQLLFGPSNSERNAGCNTLIPEGTKLISASVKDKVAYLNFSDEFQYNTHGVEGYIAQLMQIVFTATEFSSVDKVQFMIEGAKKDYLGSEGVWIGSPLSRMNF